MAGKKLKFIIKAYDGFSKVLKKARRGISSFVRFHTKAMRGVLRAGRFAFKGLALSAVLVGAALKQSFQFETWEAMFGRMYNSVEKGKEAVKDLTMLAAKTPFTIPGIIKTSRQVQVFTDNARGGIKDMIMLGDAAAYVNANVEEVGFWFGRAYNAIEAGRPMGRAALRLQELGVMSGKTRNLLEDMGKMKGSKKPTAKAMLDLLIKDFMRFEGTMSTLVGTGDQLWSNLTDMGIWSLKKLGDEVKELAKNRMQDLTKALIKLNKNGTISQWGRMINSWLIKAEDRAKLLWGQVDKFLKAKPPERKSMMRDLGAEIGIGFKKALDSIVPNLIDIGNQIGSAILASMKAGAETFAIGADVRSEGVKDTFWSQFWKGMTTFEGIVYALDQTVIFFGNVFKEAEKIFEGIIDGFKDALGFPEWMTFEIKTPKWVDKFRRKTEQPPPEMELIGGKKEPWERKKQQSILEQAQNEQYKKLSAKEQELLKQQLLLQGKKWENERQLQKKFWEAFDKTATKSVIDLASKINQMQFKPVDPSFLRDLPEIITTPNALNMPPARPQIGLYGHYPRSMTNQIINLPTGINGALLTQEVSPTLVEKE